MYWASHSDSSRSESTEAKRKPGSVLDWDRFYETAKTTTTREVFLTKLKNSDPAPFQKDSYLMVRRSQSPCHADVTGDHPRMIQMGFEGGLIFAYTTPTKGRCGRTLEAFSYSEGRYSSKKLVWPKGQDGTEGSLIQDSNTCIRCHGNPPKLIFRANSDLWPRFLGEFGGLIEPDTLEGRELVGFLEKNGDLQKGNVHRMPYSLLSGFDSVFGLNDLSDGKSNLATNDGNLSVHSPRNIMGPVIPNIEGIHKFMKFIADKEKAGGGSIEESLTQILYDEGQSRGRPFTYEKLETNPPPALPVILPKNIRGAAPGICMTCHDSSGKKSFYIPFENPEAMRRALLDPNDALYAAILEVTNSNDPNILMPPPDYGTLSPADRKDLRFYLDSLAPELQGDPSAVLNSP